MISFTEYDGKRHKLRNALKIARINRIHELVLYDMSLIYDMETLPVSEEVEDKEDYEPNKNDLNDPNQRIELSYPDRNVLCTLIIFLRAIENRSERGFDIDDWTKITHDMYYEQTRTSHDAAMLVKRFEMAKDTNRLDMDDVFKDVPWKQATGKTTVTPVTTMMEKNLPKVPDYLEKMKGNSGANGEGQAKTPERKKMTQKGINNNGTGAGDDAGGHSGTKDDGDDQASQGSGKSGERIFQTDPIDKTSL